MVTFLASIPLIIIGFILRLNAFMVITAVAIYADLVSDFNFVKIISDIGKSFVDSRYVTITWLICLY